MSGETTVPKKRNAVASSKAKKLAFVTSNWAKRKPPKASSPILVETESLSDHAYEPWSSKRLLRPAKKPSPAKKEKSLNGPYKLGLFPLHPNADDARSNVNFPVDIIALHGINGDAFSTWTYERGDEEKEFWLQDYLPDEFPGARIYTFGYDARIFFSPGTGDIESFAKTLLEDIRNERTHREEQRRPIIFIAHSMGGLVVKKALTIASSDLARYGTIKESTTSIFFMATPHRGSSHAATLAKLAKVVNFPFANTLISRFTGQMRRDLISGLKNDNPKIKKIAIDFESLTDGSIKFFTFLEMMKTKPLRRKIVPEASAIIGVRPEMVFRLDEDHKSIVRYTSRDSPSFKRVLAQLKEAVEEAKNPYIAKIGQEDQPCLRTLFFESMTYRKSETSKAHGSTCTWVLLNHAFTEWQSSSNGLLWIKGHPGSGKSTLMAFLRANIEQSQTSRALFVDFFFSGRGDVLQKSPSGMYRSLLHQLYQQSMHARSKILEIFEEKTRTIGNNDWEWQAFELRAMLKTVVREVAEIKEITIFVDALDEAVDEHGEKASQALLQYFYELNDSKVVDEGILGGLKICIACRHYPVVGSLGPGTIIEVEKWNFFDIRDFIHDTLRITVLGWNLESTESHERLVSAIAEKADGNFQWASLRVPKLAEHLNDGDKTFEGIEKMIASESNELFPLYESIFNSDISIDLREQALFFWQWVCFAESPLSLTELRYAMVCDDEDAIVLRSCEDSEHFVETDKQMEKLARSLSGGLVEVRSYEKKTTVQFIHETVREFLHLQGLQLLVSKIVAVPASYEGAILGKSHARLARSCLNYLRIDKVQQEALEWLDGVDSRPSFLEYATKSWKFHAESAENNGVPQECIVEIFSSLSDYFEVWVDIFRKLESWHKRCPARRSTLLHDAVDSNLRSVVKVLLQCKVSVNIKNDYGVTALHLAASHGNEEIAALLLDAGADVDVEDGFEATPLGEAATNGHESVAKLLVNRGADINGGNARYGTALGSAAAKGALPLVQFLIDNGADVNARSSFNETALQMAANKGREAVVNLLISRGADVNAASGKDYGNALHVAARSGCEKICQALLEAGADINAAGGEYGYALQAAMRPWNPNISLAKMLLGRGADINAVGGKFGTALQAAAERSSLHYSEDLVKFLLDAGADVNLRGGIHGCAFLAAVSCGNEDCMRLLIAHGAYTNPEGGEAGSGLQQAVASRSTSIVKYFLDKGAEVNARHGEHGTALHTAVEKNAEKIVDFLLENGADVNASGSKEFGTVLNLAVGKRMGEDMIRKLLVRGAKPICTPSHLCALERAAERGNVDIPKLLIDHGADVNCRGGGWRISALQAAAIYGHKEVVELLLDRGADLSFQTKKYGCPLQLAIWKSRVSTVQLLLDRGADPNARDNFFTPLEVAKGNETITRILLDKGAKQTLVAK